MPWCSTLPAARAGSTVIPQTGSITVCEEAVATSLFSSFFETRHSGFEADQPGVQFYTTNFRPVPVSPTPTIGKGGVEYRIHEALALETQKYPNAINFPASVHPGREDEIIRPDQGETYSHKMVIKFSAE